ncbi:nitrate/nitrite transporter [Actinospica robiniae]|uniref:Nitrate/nitrite transporter n=1 Tax=Actinospica robiniae DSM 44927 TaxID=479430 RepID=W9DZJ6_9ACTN|nr:nitrate/nitrite transporter [Actinospica robiniae]ETA71025.1 nitrate/nitrite transporter [Actinospica robiniae DSM 44927]
MATFRSSSRAPLTGWRPEDPRFWYDGGARVARRNLFLSILTEHVGFSVWSLWSVLVLFLGPADHVDAAGKFLLTAVPTLVGSCLRVPYSILVVRFGGRTWTVISALLLLIPCGAAAIAVKPGVSYGTLVLLAALAGVGGGNFASSMTNINAFYPQHRKGWALGLNAGGGNLGVAVVQLVGLAVLSWAGAGHPRLLAGIYLPLIVIGAAGAALWMDNLPRPETRYRAVREVCKEPHTWIVSLLYIGTFGSFIGFSFAFGQVLQIQFAGQFATPVKAAGLTFLGPLIGSLARPLGGRAADRWGGARVTVWSFGAMAVGAAAVWESSRTHSLPGFVAGFVWLFALSGVGNGSVYKLIPGIFKGRTGDPARDQALGGALIAIAGAVGAFGGVLVNLAFRESFLTYHSATGAYVAFIACYLVCGVLTRLVYQRAEVPAAKPVPASV